MTIIKNETVYTVEERKTCWTVKKTVGKLDVDFQIDKTIAGTFDELKAYILKNDAF